VNGRASRFLAARLLVALLSLAGCAQLNDSLVRIRFEDRNLSNRMNSEIREGLEKRKSAPEQVQPRRPAPAFLDRG